MANAHTPELRVEKNPLKIQNCKQITTFGDLCDALGMLKRTL